MNATTIGNVQLNLSNSYDGEALVGDECLPVHNAIVQAHCDGEVYSEAAVLAAQKAVDQLYLSREEF